MEARPLPVGFTSHADTGDVLAPMIAQLRDFGVLGGNQELEELLTYARLDVPRALNIYFDSGSVAVAMANRGEALDHEALGTNDVAAGELRSRGRRQAKRHGVDAQSAVAHCLAVRHAPERPSGRDKKSSDCRVLLTGQEEGHATVRYSAHGVAFDVDVRAMEQRDAVTGQVSHVRRLRPGCWSVKKSSQKSNGWTPYPKELAHELERVYEGRRRSLAESAMVVSDEPLLEDPGRCVSHGPAPSQIEALLARESGLELGAMGRDEVDATVRIAFEEAVRGPRHAAAAAVLLVRLARRQGLQCSAADARRAGLVVGSMVLLRAVIESTPSMSLLGAEVFDQKYAGIKLNERGRKDGIRSLLARGMTLGSHAPSSKLLRKVEADSVPLWEARFIDAMLRTFPLIPEQAILRIGTFLS
mmetsp:Transcript_113112/g.320112  ORF Transcript_113112/g.320112 Transcript_113112/m.320112 type:complete len:415 (-) Transcript_113112:102-1346(-)